MSDEPRDYDPNEPVVTLNWTMADVRSMAEENDPPIDLTLAMDRAREWGKFIEETCSNLAGEQLSNVVTVGQP